MDDAWNVGADKSRQDRLFRFEAVDAEGGLPRAHERRLHHQGKSRVPPEWRRNPEDRAGAAFMKTLAPPIAVDDGAGRHASKRFELVQALSLLRTSRL